MRRDLKQPDRMPKRDRWNPPELAGHSQGQVHEYFEQLGCRAAREGKKALKDAHEAWMHGWLMEMENAGKVEHLKNGSGVLPNARRGSF
jgi:hypothetical protein